LLVLLFAVGFFVFKDYLLLEKLYIFKDIGSDTANQQFPLFVHISKYIQDFGIPTWSFNLGMGMNIFPIEIKNPLYWFLYMSSPETVGYKIVFVEYVKTILGGLFFFLYLKTIRIRSYSSIVGGLLYSFSGLMILGGGWYGYSTTMMFSALLLFSFELLLLKNKWYLMPLAVFFLADFRLYFAGIFMLIYSAFRFLDVYGFNIKKYLYLMARMIGCGVLGIMLAAPFLASIASKIFNSPRVSGDASLVNKFMDYPVFGLESAHHYITVVMRVFSSDLLGTGSQYKGWYNYLEAPIFYCGLLTLLLVPQVFVFLKGRKRVLYGCFLGIWVLMIVFPYFRYAYTLFAGDYYKTTLSYTVPFTLMFFGVHALNKIDQFKKVNIPVLASSLAVLLILLNISYVFQFNQGQVVDVSRVLNGQLQLVVTLFLIAYAGLIFMLGMKNMKVVAQIGIVVFLAMELGYFSSITVNNRDVITAAEYEQRVGYSDYTLEALEYIKSKDKSFYRVDKGYSSGPAVHGSMNDAFIQGFYGTPSYWAMNNGAYIKFLQKLNIIETGNLTHAKWAPGLTRPLLKTFGSVKYYLAKQEETHPFIKSSYQRIGKFQDVYAYKNKFFLPLGFTYGKYILKSDFDLLPTAQKDVAILNAFVIEDKDEKKYEELSYYNSKRLSQSYSLANYQSDINALKKEALIITYHGQKRIEGKIEVEKPKMLFFSIPQDAGWHAEVDGHFVELEKINIGFTGLLLPEGSHVVKLYYKMPYGLLLSIISIMAFFIYIGLFFYSKREGSSLGVRLST